MPTSSRQNAAGALILFAVLALVGLPLFAADGKAPPRGRIAVADFAANNTEPGTARIVRNSVEMDFFRDGSFDLLEQAQADEILKERKLQMAECRDEACAVRLGEVLKADYVIIGSVDRLDTFTVTLKVVNVKEAKIVISESVDAADMAGLRPAAARVAKRVADRIKGRGGKKGKKVTMPFPLHVGASYLYCAPAGYFADIVRDGHGAEIAARIEDAGVKRLGAGVSVQFAYLAGKREIHHAMLVPFHATAGYGVHIADFIRHNRILDRIDPALFPSVGIGACYTVNYYYGDSSRLTQARRQGMQFSLQAGLDASLAIIPQLRLHAGFLYGMLAEKKGTVSFVAFRGGLGARF